LWNGARADTTGATRPEATSPDFGRRRSVRRPRRFATRIAACRDDAERYRPEKARRADAARDFSRRSFGTAATSDCGSRPSVPRRDIARSCVARRSVQRARCRNSSGPARPMALRRRHPRSTKVAQTPTAMRGRFCSRHLPGGNHRTNSARRGGHTTIVNLCEARVMPV
jgi:hypothetical protein